MADLRVKWEHCPRGARLDGVISQSPPFFGQAWRAVRAGPVLSMMRPGAYSTRTTVP